MVALKQTIAQCFFPLIELHKIANKTVAIKTFKI
jgi:hypothetical protein